jgi:[acyl-carrier-protein] S-malonyltransferase
VFLTNFIFARCLEADGVRPDASIGLSLGEYNHLCEIGALSFAASLHLLEARGAAYEAGPDGMMMSVFPCREEQVEQALTIGRTRGSVDISLRLGKKHYVLGGETSAVETSATWLREEAFAQSNVIDPRLPMHAGVFKPAADAFRPALERAEWRSAHAAYLPNVDGNFREHQSASDYIDSLYRHVFSTVQWQRSIDLLAQRYSDATFIEVGPKSVLYNQLSREYRTLKTQHADKESCWQTSKA